MASMKSIRNVFIHSAKRANAAALLLLCAASTALAQTPTNATYSTNPPLSEPAKTHPMLMLTLAGDHQVFLKAYNDFDDLDGDGLPDVSYNHNVVYKGYFNEEKCYSYNTTTGVFHLLQMPPLPQQSTAHSASNKPHWG